MDSLQIQYFLKVAEHLSFTKAANELFISQPSVSKQISSLEKELGFKLFNRDIKNQVVLTPVGIMFQRVFTNATVEINDAMKTAGSLINQPQGKLRVGIVEGWDMAFFITECTQFFHENYPGVHLEFEGHTFKTLYAGLDSNEFDIIICLEPGLRNVDDLNILKVTDIPSIILFSAQHPLAKCEGLSPIDFKNEYFYVLPEDETPLSWDINRGYCLSQGYEPKMLEKPNRDSILLSISGGNGYAMFDTWTRYKDIKNFCAIQISALLSVCSVWKKNNNNLFMNIFNQRLMFWIEQNK